MSQPTRPVACRAAREPHPYAVMVLVLGIVGVAVPLVSFVAWYIGNRGLRDVRREPGRYDDDGLLRAGRMLGKVVAILSLVGLVVTCAVLAFYVVPWPNG